MTYTTDTNKGTLTRVTDPNGQSVNYTYENDRQKTANVVVTDYTLMEKGIVHLKKGADELHFYYDAQGKPGIIRYNRE